ncbi:MAG: prolyl oligopeptidase family serine peptidase [Firmicutes bacterium]|nr:prolyl oligopeptidase family serine peptidase [Bacillota bacterium]
MEEGYRSFLQQELRHLPKDAIDRRTPTAAEWRQRSAAMRERLRRILGFPDEELDRPVLYEVRDVIDGDGYRIEKIVFESETDPLSLVPCLIYWPSPMPETRVPAMVLACGHGGSKSSWYNQYACQLYAKLGCAVVLADPIGEEERHESGLLGLRGHRQDRYLDRTLLAGRPFIGKVVYDLTRAIDLLRHHEAVDPERIACAGSSLGGTVTQLLAAVDDRLAACVNSAWAADYREFDGTTGCCYRLHGLMQDMNQAELIALGAPHCAYLVMVGALDEICVPLNTKGMVEAARKVYALFAAEDRCRLIIDREGGHRPYHLTPQAVRWVADHLRIDTPRARALLEAPEAALHDFIQRHGLRLDRLYDVPRHHRGGRSLEIGAVYRPPEELRVLSDEERISGPYSLESWVRGLERRLPRLPEGGAALSDWLSKREDLRDRLARLLAVGPMTLRWGPGEPVSLGRYRHELGIPGFFATLREPEADQRSGVGVVYQPAGYSQAHADEDLIEEWLRLGHVVVVLDAVRLNDNELLIGRSATAFNVRLVRCAVDGLSARDDVLQVMCRSEIDDVGAWAMALDERITKGWITSRGGEVASALGKGRMEGVVPGSARVIDTLGLWAMSAPRPLHFASDVLDDEEIDRLRQVWAALGAGERLMIEGEA